MDECMGLTKDIDITCRCKDLVIVLAQSTLATTVFLRHRDQRGNGSASSYNNIVPIKIGQSELGEDIEVLLEFFERINNGWSAVGHTVLV